MKKLMLIASALTLVAGTAMAQSKPAPHKTSSQAPKMTMHTVNAEVVSFDAASKKLTVKDDKGQTQSIALESAALNEAKALKPGEKVTLTCRDNAAGEHEAITKIKPKK
jgi:Cu/Ag efflux protein CusF